MTDPLGWRVAFTRSAQRDLRRLDPPVRQRVLIEISGLRDDPTRGDVKRLAGVDPPEWRLRVGDWRVRFTVDAEKRQVVIKRVRSWSRSGTFGLLSSSSSSSSSSPV